MSEKILQQYICKKLRDSGILVFKFSSPSQRGVPDLICINQIGDTFYIEVKHPNKRGRLSTLQEITIRKMRERGARVYVCDSKEHAKELEIIESHGGPA